MSKNSRKLNPTAGNVQFKKELFENIKKERTPFLEKESRINVKDETVGPSRLKDNNTTLTRNDVDNNEIGKSMDKGSESSFFECSHNIKKVAPSFLFDVVLPTLDVYSDFSLVIGWLWNQHWKYATSMTAPLLLHFISTCYKWIRLEKKQSKRRSWIPLVLQCWPQWRALKIIWMDLKNNTETEKKRKELMREVICTEPFLEAFPSIMVMTAIWFHAERDTRFQTYCKDNPNYYECPKYNFSLIPPPQYCETHPLDNPCAVFGGPEGYYWFVGTFFISLAACSLGITKFLQNGPFAILSNKGLFGGMMKWRFVLTFLAVLELLITKFLIFGIFFGHFIRLYEIDHDFKIKEVALVALILFSAFVAPNLILSLISIAFTTGANKNFFEVIFRYPAAWMLPICTLFVIGPQKFTYKSSVKGQKHLLGFSKLLTIMNLILTISITIIADYYLNLNAFYQHKEGMIPIFIFPCLFTIILLLLDRQCCCSASQECCCQCCCGHQCYQYEKHVIDVSNNDLQIVIIDN